METMLWVALVAAAVYIMYLEARPKTDKQRKMREEMDQRIREAKSLQEEKYQKKKG